MVKIDGINRIDLRYSLPVQIVDRYSIYDLINVFVIFLLMDVVRLSGSNTEKFIYFSFLENRKKIIPLKDIFSPFFTFLRHLNPGSLIVS